MANNPSVTLTFAGDSKQVSKAMGEVGSESDRMRDRINQNSESISRNTDGSTRRMTGALGTQRDQFKETAESYEDMIRRMARAQRQLNSLERDKQLLGLPSLRDVVPAAQDAGQDAGDGFLRGFASKVTKIPAGGWLVAGLAAAAVPAASAAGLLAGGALVGGIGAGMAGLGLMVAAKSEPVKLIFTDLSNDIMSEMARISVPFEKTLLDMARDAREVFEGFRDQFAESFPDTARELSDFSGHLKDAFLQLAPVVDPVLDAFESILDDLGPMLPGVFQDIANSLIPLAETVSKNSDGFANFVVALLGIIPITLDVITALINMGTWFVTTMREIGGNIQYTADLVIGGFSRMAQTIYGWVTGVGSAVTRARDEIAGRLLAMIQDFRNWPSHIANAVGDLGRVLFNAGARLIGGLMDGIRSQMAALWSLLGQITSSFPIKKGPPEVDARLLFRSGSLIMGGLVAGMRSEQSTLDRYLGDLTAFVGGFGPSGEMRLTGAPAGGGGSSGAPERVIRFGSDGSRLGDAILTLVQEAMRENGADPSILEV